MKIHQLHPWDIPYKEAITIQRRLSKKIREIPLAKPLKTIAGADVSYSRKSHDFYAAVLVFTFPDLILVDEAMACQKVKFPYIAGLLTFREGPVLIKAFRKIRKKPDVTMFDGQGTAHPRGIGLASHMGLILDCPTIGCAKTRLVGIHAPVAENRGSTALLTDQGRVIGSVLRTRDHVKPVFVSSGHAITLAEALDLVMACCRGYRLPEPIRQAHLAVNRLRIEKEGSLS
ncbi:MAG: deoxyribonuclease V [Deltaproteobacteria bacterium]|nr:endonuclease V [Deltaproteobacteria bacterium]MCD6138004.1 deoxyribonuclease V [Deltaproteobacteria bacterium]RLB93460.1 MAG: endonuclease V [Deltaproteobacteria bacterium]RLC11045.1 MAG: endonuclease V [Deltaproteobacteria bacterium]